MIYLQKRAIATLHEAVWFYQMVAPENKYPLPSGSGTQMTFNGWQRIAAPSAVLAEASGNSAVALSSRKVNVTIQSYGRSVKFTDLFEKTSILAPKEGALKELEQCAALAVDNEMQRVIFKNTLDQVGTDTNAKTKLLSVWMSSKASAFCALTSTASYNANSDLQFGYPAVFGTSATRLSAVSATAPSTSARMGPVAIRKVVKQLRRKSAEPYADGNYMGVLTPEAWADMMGNPDWKAWQQTAGLPVETMYKHEVGMVHKVRLVESPNAPRYAVAAHSVNATFIAGRQALGVTELGGGIEYLITPKGPSKSDPFDLNNYVSFKVRLVGARLNQSAGRILFTHEL
jgi:N4-gp56 family major capsid protein